VTRYKQQNRKMSDYQQTHVVVQRKPHVDIKFPRCFKLSIRWGYRNPIFGQLRRN